MFLELSREQITSELAKVISLYLTKVDVVTPDAAPDAEEPSVVLAIEVLGDVVVFWAASKDGSTTYAVGHAYVLECTDGGDEIVSVIVHQPMTPSIEPKQLYLYKGKAFMRRRKF